MGAVEIIEKYGGRDDFENTKLVLASSSGEFENFFRHFLGFFEENLNRELDKITEETGLKISRTGIVLPALVSMRQELYMISIKTLISTIHICKNQALLRGRTSEERYDHFCKLLKRKDTILEIIQAYPVLGSLIYQKINNKLRFIRESIKNVSDNFERISRELDITGNYLEKIEFGVGDRHNDGREVLVFHFSGDRIVYKPNGTGANEVFEKVVNWFAGHDEIKKKPLPVRTVNFKDFYVQEFVEYKQCRAVEEIREYFYKTGVLLLICYVLKSTDIHSENIIASGNTPVIVDVETLFNNDNPTVFTKSFFRTFLESINDSVLGSMILPQNFDRASMDLDISGLSGGGGEKSRKMETFALVDKGTDDIRLVKRFVSMAENKNIVKINDKKVNIQDYCTDILEGFTDGYRLLLGKKKQFIELLSSFRELNPRYRQILKPTYIYGKFLDASYHPRYLKSEDDRKRLFSLLRTDSDNKSAVLSLKTGREIEELYRDDIPYFIADFITKNLYFSDGLVVKDFFAKSMIDILTERTETLSEADLKKQLCYIRQSIATTCDDVWKISYGTCKDRTRIRQKIFTGSRDFLSCAMDIGDYLYNTATWDETRECASWLTLLVSEDNKLKLGPLNHLLYEGGGVYLFLAYLYNETSDEKYRSLLYAAIRGLRGTYHIDNPGQPLSAYSGIGSLIYIFYNLSVLLGDDELYKDYLFFAGMLKDRNLEDVDPKYDFLGGLAGMTELCLNIYEADGNRDLLDFAKRCGYKLSRYIQNTDERLLTGLSHGYAGYALALIHLGHILKESMFYDLGMQLVRRENCFYRPYINNWEDLRGNSRGDQVYWCHGAAGIGLARAAALRYCRHEDYEYIRNDVYKCIDKVKNNGLDPDLNHCMCHGLFGNIDILLTISRILRDRTSLKYVYEKAGEILERVQENGLEYGLAGSTDLLSGMLGLSGIGMALLRLENNAYPSILNLGIVKRKDVYDEVQNQE